MKKHQPTLDHALHNEELCMFLCKHKKFNDWVITTAYYSAIYFVNYELFPDQFEISDRMTRCQNFAEYYVKLPRPKDSKHSVREDLVHEHLKEIYTSFSTLRELSSTARYKTYKISEREVKLALECLSEVKALCCPTT